MSRLRIAVLGAGRIAQEHLKVLTARPDCEVVLLCDPDPERRRTTAERFGIPEEAEHPCSVLRRDDLDAAWVLVSVRSVAAVAEPLLRAGLPLLVEKPPGLYSSETARLAEIASASGAVATVGLNRRFYSTNQAARQAILDQGGPLSLTVEAHEDLARVDREKFPEELLRRWSIANGVHALDLLRFFGGECRVLHRLAARYENSWYDSHSALLAFENGAVGRAQVDWFSPGAHAYQVRALGAVAVAAPGFGSIAWMMRGAPAVEFTLAEVDRAYKAGFWAQAEAFLTGVRDGKQPEFPVPSLEDAWKSQLLIEQICGLTDSPTP
ncbi:MAG: Gfo/Idh/MocA family oxidoreductase [Armatimonadetes bacterium]|nr:Gfo/Idh/MocA family oxidoreductase [Armatimonadota bacterium]